jgi:hypothetical protein
MSVLLAILSHPKDNSMVRRHWFSYKSMGWKILGCGTQSGGCEWPEKVRRLDSGIEGTRQTQAGSALFGLVLQEADIYREFLNNTKHDSLMIIESDGVFTRKLPEHPGGYLFTQMPDFAQRGMFKSSVYAQTGRWSDRPTTEKLLRFTEQAIAENDVEAWMSDRLPAWLCYKHHIKFQPFPGWSPFAFPNWGEGDFNTQWKHDARAAIKLGAAYIHACKTEEQLKSIRDLIKL